MLDPQTVERLIMDDALGRLEPDVAALLKEYLAAHPEMNADARQYAALAATAQRALETTEPLVLPRFPRESSAPQLRVGRSRLFTWPQLAVAAACLCVGVGLGHVLTTPAARVVTPEQPPPPIHSTDPRTSAPALAAVRLAEPSPSDAFWSTRRLMKKSLEESRRPEIPVQWVSPVEAPRLKKGEL